MEFGKKRGGRNAPAGLTGPADITGVGDYFLKVEALTPKGYPNTTVEDSFSSYPYALRR